MKHFDLFSGYGGFSLALQKAYENNSINKGGERNGQALSFDRNKPSAEHGPRRTESAETIGFSEIDKYASAVLKYHWPNTKNYGDITKINWSEVPDFDLLTGGSPCQDLSIAGKRQGLSGGRSGLFYEYARCLQEKKPKYFIWENVKGALSSNKGLDFAIVLTTLSEAGYSLWWQVLNAKDFGVPQNRERIFVVGTRGGNSREIFFERGNDETRLEQNSPQGSDILKSPIRSQGDKPMIYQRARGKNNGGEKDICPTISKSSFEHNNHLTEKNRIRKLMPVECERLMGLPDDWTKNGDFYPIQGVADTKEISDSQRYKLCGNGVVVNVVEKIIKELIC